MRTLLQERDLFFIDDEKVLPVSLNNIREDFKALLGVYPQKHGANCFAATMYRVTRNQYFIQWGI